MPTEGHVEANGLRFAYLEDGPADGPLALCLHGFPDSAWTWRHLLPELASAGYHAVAPFLRGYAPTEVPDNGVYGSGVLVADTNGLHEALGGDGRAVLIGHDWGAIAGYGAAAHEPERWRRVVTAAVPPMGSMSQGFLNYDQLRRSWYIFFIQNPLADIVVPMNDLEFIDRLWADWSPGYDAAEDLVHVKDCLKETANLTAALGYYRAMFGTPPAELADQAAAVSAPTPQPTLYLHGVSDGCVGVGLAQGVEAFLGPGSEVFQIGGAGHFLHLEKPAEVNGLILQFLGRD